MASAKEHVEIEVAIGGGATRTVSVTSPDKVFFTGAPGASGEGRTKRELVEFYRTVAPVFLAANGGRPTMLQRHPDGASGKSFFQKRVPEGAPDWLETTEVATVNGTTSNALVLADAAHIVWAVNLGCLGFHPWPYLAASPETTDELRIDLDPSPGVTFDMVREGALATKELLDEVGVRSYVKTTGSKGLHVYARLRAGWDSYEVRAAAVAVARELERRRPDLLTAAWWKEERGTRVFVDFNQNAPHKTVFGAWCVRSRVGAQVSTPLAWDEVASVDHEALTIATVPARLAADGDPWAAMDADPQDLEPLLERSRADLAAGLMDAPWPPVYPKQPNEPPRVAPSRAKQS